MLTSESDVNIAEKIVPPPKCAGNSMRCMEITLEAALNRHLAIHYGVVGRQQAFRLGLTETQVDWLVRSRRWSVVHRGVYRRSGTVLGPEGHTLAACLALGRTAVASHRSAAWLWGLVAVPPDEPTVTVLPAASGRLAGAEVHRHADLRGVRRRYRLSIPVTDVARSLCDLGESAPAALVDEAVDRALARRLVSVPAMSAEVERLAHQAGGGRASCGARSRSGA